jgi:hypothetical protein
MVFASPAAEKELEHSPDAGAQCVRFFFEMVSLVMLAIREEGVWKRQKRTEVSQLGLFKEGIS